MSEPTNIKKPYNLQDLMIAGMMTRGDIQKIGRDIFDGNTTGAGPEGYVVTLPKFDDIPVELSQWLVKIIALYSKVENVFDAKDNAEAEEADDITGRRLAD